MRDDGFGPIGNMLLFTVGFFAAILAANSYGIAAARPHACHRDRALAAPSCSIAVLALLKAGLAAVC